MSVSTAGGLVSLFGADPAGYVPHALHGPGRTYTETNCYSDILIELLHARGDEPLAAMGAVLRLDFEGDQWTFFKPAPADLELLFGIDIHEMQPYRPLPEQIAEQITLGRSVIVELDAWHLPDTAAMSYRSEHVKTSVATEAIDVGAQRLRYFHNAGLHELADEDYRGVFRLGHDYSDDVLPPYTELARFDSGPRLVGAELHDTALGLARAHLDRRPVSDPFARFADHLATALPGLLAGDAALYHAYAFATVRMVGSGFEVGAAYVDWLLRERGVATAAALMRIVDGSKVLSLKLARRRAFDPAPVLGELGRAWDEAMTRLDDALPR